MTEELKKVAKELVDLAKVPLENKEITSDDINKSISLMEHARKLLIEAEMHCYR